MGQTRHFLLLLLLLYLLLLFFSTLSLCGATEYYVRPTEPVSTFCPGQPCLTFSQYINGAVHFFQSNTTFKFLPGTHQVNVSVIIRNVHNISLLASETKKKPLVIFQCPSKCSSNFESGDCPSNTLFCLFVFNNSSNITIDGLSIVVQPQSIPERLSWIKAFEFKLAFEYTASLYFKNSQVRMTNSSWRCYINVLASHYVEISSFNITNGGIYVKSTDNINITNVTAVSCRHYCIGMDVSLSTNVYIKDTNTIYSHIGYYFSESEWVILNNVTAANFAKCIIYMKQTRNTIMKSTVLTSGEVLTREMGILVANSLNVTISASVFQFFSAPFLTTINTLRQPAVVHLQDSRNVTIKNCTFLENNITALKLVRTCIKVFHTLNFTSNRAYRGGAMFFIDGSSMTLSRNSYVTYTNNKADDTGGAIYIANSYFTSFLIASQKCFLEFDNEYIRNPLIFINNSAGQGGEVLYRGSMGSACTYTSDLLWDNCGFCLKLFNDTSVVTPYTWSTISSDPSRVCFCSGKVRPDFLTVFYPKTFSIHPGQTIVISVAVMGDNLGTVAGSVFAHIQHPLELEAGQAIQEAQQHHCNKLSYTIYTQVEEKQVLLTLTSVKRNVEEDQYTQESIEYLIEGYINGDAESMEDILDLPMYVNINVLPCPPGFELTNSPSKCGCKKHLLLLSDVTCDVQYLTIQRRGLVWVGPLTDDNNTVVDVMSAPNCPLNYCKNEIISITLNQSETQCNYNRSGTLCGGCQRGLSLALGSAQCLKCSNKYLALLIPFALSGVVLVLFIKILNLTLAKGFIGGQIFYANIVKPNQHIFLPQMNTNPLTLFVAWLNLDLGIETCFVDGLTAYWKTWLQFVFPFYIWAIAGLIIISARYSIRLARLMGNNSVPVLATLFLLSYAKLLRTTITIMSYTVVETPHGQKTVWSADGNIDYLGPQHTPLFLAAIATLLFLWLPYTLLLLLGQWLRKINHRYISFMLMKMKPFLDAHYGPLKDKHHYWFGVLLCVRVIILLTSAGVPSNDFSIFTLSISTTAGALISFISIGPTVYRNFIVSTFEIFFFINLGLLGLAKFYTYVAGGNQVAATYTLIGVAFTQFLGLVSYQIYSLFKPLFSHCRAHRDDDDGVTENIWRYDTSTELSLSKWKSEATDTPYQDATTAI